MLGIILPEGLKAEAATVKKDLILEERAETVDVVTSVKLTNDEKERMFELGFTEKELISLTALSSDS